MHAYVCRVFCAKFIATIDRQQFCRTRKQIKIAWRKNICFFGQHRNRNRILQIAFFFSNCPFINIPSKKHAKKSNEIGQRELLLPEKMRTVAVLLFFAASETTSHVRNGNFTAFRLQFDALAACRLHIDACNKTRVRWYWKINSPFLHSTICIFVSSGRVPQAPKIKFKKNKKRNIEIERHNLLFVRERRAHFG